MKWPHLIGRTSVREIQAYVRDKEWQSFRASLKGQPTQEKLERLIAYREVHLVNGRLPRRYQVLIDNYLNALKRGGQLSIKGEVVNNEGATALDERR